MAVTVEKHLKWSKDPKLESWLKGLEVKFESRTVPLAEIDIVGSLDRQSRLGRKKDDDLVLKYAQSMENGDAFPMPLLIALSDRSKFDVPSGLHRVLAADFLGTEQAINAYVIINKPPLLTLDLIRRAVNTKEGKQETKEAVLAHVAWMVVTHGMETSAAAKEFGLPVKLVQDYLLANEVRDTLANYGVDVSKLGRWQMRRLNTISDNHKVLVESAKSIIGGGAGSKETEELPASLKAAVTEKEKLETVRRVASTWKQPSANGRVAKFRSSERDRVLNNFARLSNCMFKFDAPEKLPFSTEVAAAFRRDWAVLKKHVDALLKGGA